MQQVTLPEFLATAEGIRGHVYPILDYLYTARPTAVNLGNATRRLKKLLEDLIAAKEEPKAIVDALIAEGKLISDEDLGRNKAMAKWGGDWLINRVQPSSAKTLNVLTVCNTGSLATSVSLQTCSYLESL